MSITLKTLEEAIADAERFISFAKRLKQSSETFTPRFGDNADDIIYVSGKNAAAVKRASMDLSRTLTNIRQGR